MTKKNKRAVLEPRPISKFSVTEVFLTCKGHCDAQIRLSVNLIDDKDLLALALRLCGPVGPHAFTPLSVPPKIGSVVGSAPPPTV